MPRNSQAASAKRRVERIHWVSTRRAMSAPTAKANGIVNSVYPEYSIGGWIIMLGWRSSGLRPAPSGGTEASCWNGFANPTRSIAKNDANTHRTAVAHGVTWRRRRPVSASTRLDHSDSSQIHSSSEPSWEDHAAVTL